MLTSLHKPKLVCFDLGGVLVRICRTWREACVAAGHDLRGPWRDSDVASDTIQQLSIQLSTGAIDFPNWAQRIRDEVGGCYSINEITLIHRAILIGEYEGVSDMIDRIHDAGLQTASLSNTDAQHWTVIEQYPAVQRLQHRHASHLLRLVKPDPEIYRAFQRRLNVQPHDILFLDDLPANVDAARATGWHTELIDPHRPTDVQIESAVRRFHAI